MSEGRKARFKDDLSSLTNSMIDSLMDAVLYVTFNALTHTGIRTMRQANYAMYEADVLLCRYNSQTIRRAIDNLRARRYIQKKKVQSGVKLTITHEGMKRINELIPTFKDRRPWDGYLYLISYDIPIQSNPQRNLLRKYLRRIGCGKLQDSLWMTPYNPTEIIDIFVEDHHIPGTILVSKLGKDGTIGSEDRRSLIQRVYSYEKLKRQYEEFIQKYKSQKGPSRTQLSIDYHTILKDDPQLPFLLEPDNFPAKSAHRLFQSFFT